MNDLLDVYTLVMLGIALLLIWKLRSVLGTRTGNERPPYNPYSNESDKPSKPSINQGAGKTDIDGIVTIPSSNHNASGDTEADVDQSFDLPQDLVIDDSRVRETLHVIEEKDSYFEPESFVSGASSAYEIIVMAFARGDKEELKTLLSSEVFQNFSSVIEERQKHGETVETRFVGFDKRQITDARLEKTMAFVTVHFEAQLVSVTKDSEGRIIDGDPNEILSVNDIWTFRRDVGSSDPNWLLSETLSSS